MALYLNGTKLNSLVVDGGDIQGVIIPKIISGQSANRATTATLSYTFTEGGRFQYYIFISSSSTPASTDVTVKINGTAITPTFYSYSDYISGWFYGEIIVSSNDVISVTNNVVQTHRGMQLFVLQDADISVFQVLGVKSNEGNTFSLDYDNLVYLENYHWSYYNGNNVLEGYHTGTWNLTSIPTPNLERYYYGGTWAIQIR